MLGVEGRGVVCRDVSVGVISVSVAGKFFVKRLSNVAGGECMTVVRVLMVREGGEGLSGVGEGGGRCWRWVVVEVVYDVNVV